MLQRIQTVYLLLAFACTSALLFFPIFIIKSSYEGIETEIVFDAYGLNTSGSTEGQFPLYILFIILAVLTFFGVLLFKNRKKQLLIVRLSFIFHLLTALAFLLFALLGKQVLTHKIIEMGDKDINIDFSYGIGYYLLFISIPFLLLAIKGIKADEQLVKSLDRIR